MIAYSVVTDGVASWRHHRVLLQLLVHFVNCCVDARN